MILSLLQWHCLRQVTSGRSSSSLGTVPDRKSKEHNPARLGSLMLWVPLDFRMSCRWSAGSPALRSCFPPTRVRQCLVRLPRHPHSKRPLALGKEGLLIPLVTAVRASFVMDRMHHMKVKLAVEMESLFGTHHHLTYLQLSREDKIITVEIWRRMGCCNQ